MNARRTFRTESSGVIGLWSVLLLSVCIGGSVMAADRGAQSDARLTEWVSDASLEQGNAASSDPCPIWDADSFLPDLNGTVTVSVRYRDDLIVAGSFTRAGGVPVNNIARWDGSRWNSLGRGLDGGTVDALAVFQRKLIAAGRFTDASGEQVQGLAAWDGDRWRPFAPGVRIFERDHIDDLKAWGDTLLVSGSFTLDHTDAHLALWDGRRWASLPPFDGRLFPSDVTVVGSQLFALFAGDYPVVCSWNGAAWVIHSLLLPAGSYALASTHDSLLVAGSRRITSHSETGVIFAYAHDTTSVLVDSLPLRISGLVAHQTGIYFVMGASVCRLSRGSYDELLLFAATGGGVARLDANLTLTGSFEAIGDHAAYGVALWNGRGWDAPLSGGDALDGPIADAVAYKGKIYVGGGFHRAGQVHAPSMACRPASGWETNGWEAPGIRLSYASYHGSDEPQVRQLTVFQDRLWVTGDFDSVDGVFARGLAVFDGDRWLAKPDEFPRKSWPDTYDSQYPGLLLAIGDTLFCAKDEPRGVWALADGQWIPYATDFRRFTAHMTSFRGRLIAVSYYDNAIVRLGRSGAEEIGRCDDRVSTLAEFQDRLVMIGGFQHVDTLDVRRLAAFDGRRWTSPYRGDWNAQFGGAYAHLVVQGNRLLLCDEDKLHSVTLNGEQPSRLADAPDTSVRLRRVFDIGGEFWVSTYNWESGPDTYQLHRLECVDASPPQVRFTLLTGPFPSDTVTCVIAVSEACSDDPVTLSWGDTSVPLRLADPSRHIWSGDLALRDMSTPVAASVCVHDASGNEGCSQRSYLIQRVASGTGSSIAVGSYPLALEIEPGRLEADGLVLGSIDALPAGGAGPENGILRVDLRGPPVRTSPIGTLTLTIPADRRAPIESVILRDETGGVTPCELDRTTGRVRATLPTWGRFTLEGGTSDPFAVSPAMHLSAAPNPFADRCLLRLPPWGAGSTLRVFDASGRQVHGERIGVTQGRASTVEWDGLDDAGRLLPDGVYLVLVERGADRDATKVVRVQRRLP